MPREKTDVVRRSLFGARTLTPGAGEPDVGEKRRPNAKPNQNRSSGKRASTATGQSRNREAAPVSPTPIGRRSVERTAVTVPTDLLMRVKDAVAVLECVAPQDNEVRLVAEAV